MALELPRPQRTRTPRSVTSVTSPTLCAMSLVSLSPTLSAANCFRFMVFASIVSVCRPPWLRTQTRDLRPCLAGRSAATLRLRRASFAPKRTRPRRLARYLQQLQWQSPGTKARRIDCSSCRQPLLCQPLAYVWRHVVGVVRAAAFGVQQQVLDQVVRRHAVAMLFGLKVAVAVRVVQIVEHVPAQPGTARQRAVVYRPQRKRPNGKYQYGKGGDVCLCHFFNVHVRVSGL